jgi:hypothetical protein
MSTYNMDFLVLTRAMGLHEINVNIPIPSVLVMTYDYFFTTAITFDGNHKSPLLTFLHLPGRDAHRQVHA